MFKKESRRRKVGSPSRETLCIGSLGRPTPVVRSEGRPLPACPRALGGGPPGRHRRRSSAVGKRDLRARFPQGPLPPGGRFRKCMPYKRPPGWPPGAHPSQQSYPAQRGDALLSRLRNALSSGKNPLATPGLGSAVREAERLGACGGGIIAAFAVETGETEGQRASTEGRAERWS